MTHIDFTHDAQAQCWVVSANGHADFPIQNLPLGIFSPRGGGPRGGVAIGDAVLDIAKVAALLDETVRPFALLAGQDSLNALLGAGNGALRALRQALFQLLADDADRMAVEPALHDRKNCTLHLPARIGDYTDFYTGIHHAENVGKLFRPDNPLLPNYKYLPIGYHGRSSSIRLSGTNVRRPRAFFDRYESQRGSHGARFLIQNPCW
jgi:fumarylacetoacetase